MPTGRPTKLTPKVQKAIVALVEAGDIPEVAAGVQNVGRRTYFDWMTRGEAGERPYAAFRTAVTHAIDRFHSQARAAVLKGDERGTSFGPAKAALEVLSRRLPRQWAQQVKHHVETVEDEFFGELEKVCSDPDVLARVCAEKDLRVVFVALCEGLARQQGEGAAPPDPSDRPGTSAAVHH